MANDTHREYVEGEIVSSRRPKDIIEAPTDDIAAELRARKYAPSSHVLLPPQTTTQRLAAKLRETADAIKNVFVDQADESTSAQK